MEKLKIRKWDPTTMRNDALVLLLGKRGTGKTTLLKDLCFWMRDKVDFGLAMSPTEECTDSLGSFIPESWIYNDFDEGKVAQLMETQRQQWKGGSGYNCFLILDDCMYDKKVLKSKTMRQLFMNGRHRRVFFVTCQQYCMDMGPDMRSQIDYVFALRDPVISSRKKLWEQFFGFFQNYQAFAKVMDQCTNNFECLVYDGKAAKTNNIEDCIFWYKASTDLPEFRMGRDIFWDLHARYYSNKEDEIEALRVQEELKEKEQKKKTKYVGVVKGTSDGQTMVEGRSYF